MTIFEKIPPEREEKIKKELETFNPNSRWNRKPLTGKPIVRKKLKTNNRTERLMPNGVPRYVRCYRNGYDYTVVFTGRLEIEGKRFALTLTDGLVAGNWYDGFIDRPSYIHLGTKVRYDDLPSHYIPRVIAHYRNLWRINDDGNTERG